MATCYRHPKRETGVSCSNCGRPICTSCMTPTSVGMRCPECAGEKTQIRTVRSLGGGEPQVTIALIAICVIAFLGTGSTGAGLGGGGNSLFDRGALFGPLVADGDWWRLVTSGFLHSGLMHIFFNMYLLWMLGRELEPVMGSRRFGALYGTALLCGSLGSLIQTTESPVVGASGAVFGLMGATAVELRRRGHSPFSGGLGGLIFLNLMIGFIPGLNIAFGGHIGGLVGGTLAALGFDLGDRRRLRWLGYVLCAVLAVAAVAGAFAVAGSAHDYRLKF